jgi:hypothetical protein
MIPKEIIPRVEVLECLQGQNRDKCKGDLGHNTHELMPPRIKIVPEGNNTRVYRYTSPIKSEFVLRKLMKFTVPVSVIPLQSKNVSEMIKDMEKFDDARLYDNVLFSLVSSNP